MNLTPIFPGQRFHRLTTIAKLPSEKKFVMWACVCDCGKETKIRAAHLRNGANKSCGCMLREIKATRFRNHSASIKLPVGVSSGRKLYHNYSLAATKRGLKFSLSRDYFLTLTKENCHYCGAPPSQIRKNTANSHGVYIYNGVDRIDSGVGYTVENVVPCCKICNFMKSTLTIEEFKSHIQHLASRIAEGAF